MNKKHDLGQFFTTRADYIVGDLIKFIPISAHVVDPFAGEWDLLNMLDKKTWRDGYDIDPKVAGTHKRDSLLQPLGYDGCWILTNPPYLGRNKSDDKRAYDFWGVDDLYKAALHSIETAEGGIIIIPLNFLSCQDSKTRLHFLRKFKIKQLKIFEEQVFDDTSYTVCAFAFVKSDNSEQVVPTTFYPSGKKVELVLRESEGYRIGGEFFELLKNGADVEVSRLIGSQRSNSSLFLRALDTGSPDGRIKLEICDEPYRGKFTDRAFATLRFDKKFTIEEQRMIAATFNKILEAQRKKHNSLFLSAFRNSTSHYSRKRIAFDDAYALVKHVIKKLKLDR